MAEHTGFTEKTKKTRPYGDLSHSMDEGHLETIPPLGGSSKAADVGGVCGRRRRSEEFVDGGCQMGVRSESRVLTRQFYMAGKMGQRTHVSHVMVYDTA